MQKGKGVVPALVESLNQGYAQKSEGSDSSEQQGARVAASAAASPVSTGGVSGEAFAADGLSERDALVAQLLVAHEAWYDVARDYEFAGRTFPGYAEFHSHGEKYVLVKSAKLWEVDAHEYIFFDAVERLSDAYLSDAIAFMKEKAIAKVKPVPNHMQSFLSLVIVADSLDDGVEKAIRRTRYRKNFQLGIRGWADLRVAAIDLQEGRVITNGMGKEMKPALESNLAHAKARAQREQ